VLSPVRDYVITADNATCATPVLCKLWLIPERFCAAAAPAEAGNASPRV